MQSPTFYSVSPSCRMQNIRLAQNVKLCVDRLVGRRLPGKMSHASSLLEGVRQPCLKPFVHQVGGHVGVLLWNADTVCKPYSASEVLFYERAPDQFRQFMPSYMGTADVSFDELVDDESNERTLVARSVKFVPPASSVGEGGQHLTLTQQAKCKIRFRMKRSGSIELTRKKKQKSSETAQWLLHEVASDSQPGDSAIGTGNDRTYAQHPWALQCQAACVARLRATTSTASDGQPAECVPHRFVLLQNLVGGMQLPCVLDLKMGVRQHGDNAPKEKVLRMTDRCKRSTSAKLGVRLVGMQVYDRTAAVYRCATKNHGRRIDATGLRHCMRLFVFGPNQSNASDARASSALVDGLLTKLHQLKDVIAKADGCRFYSSSLLLLYDAAGSAEDGQRCDVRMIDFVNSVAVWADCGGKLRTGPDDGYLLGLDSLIGILRGLRDSA